MFKRIISIYRNHKKQVAVVLFMTLIVQGLGIINPYVFGKMLDTLYNSVAKHEGIYPSMALLAIAYVIYVLQNFINVARVTYNQKNLFFPVREFVRRESLQKYLAFSIGQLKNNHSGVSKDVMSNGETALVNLARVTVMVLLPVVARITITSGMSLMMQPTLGAIIILGATVYTIVTLYFQKKYMPRIEETRDSFLETGRHRSEILTGASLIITNTKEETMTEAHCDKNHKSNLTAIANNLFMNVRNSGMLVFMGSVEYLALALAIYFIFTNKMTPGELITVRIWWGMLTSSIADLGSMYPDALDNISDIKKFFNLIDIPPAIKEVENPISLSYIGGFINFERVSFAYPNDDLTTKKGGDVVKDVTIRIRGGERVAIVGPSGSGKTTLINLLLRGYDPDKGHITIDGVNLKSLNLKDFRRKIALVDQNAQMFDDTLRNNILFGTDKAMTDEELKQVCDLAQVRFTDKLTNGLDTMIGQNGVKISGGERQRVAIARALARNPDLLILDEATSSLDTINESLIKKALAEASRNRTVITIAHRLSTVRDADRIFVMEDGMIVSVGNHEELMGKSVLYQKLVENDLVKV